MKNEKFKVALITGSTHGIGKAIAIKLANERLNVVLNGTSTKKLPSEYLEKLTEIYKNELNEKFLFIQADISNKEDRKKIIHNIKEKFARIDVLINNAGIAPSERKDILEANEESFERVIKINLQGPYFLTQEVAKWMISLRERFGNDYRPIIINISSISSFMASLNRGEYCISKAGMSMMTKLYAIRLSEYNIPVFEIQPGIILTRMTEPVKEKYDEFIQEGLIPMNRWGYPKDVAKVVLSIIQGALPYSTGDIVHIDGGFHLQKL
jgi:NAD(P)-dependent dehydrogenase (short-subunit alcohol dehydrogenase family)